MATASVTRETPKPLPPPPIKDVVLTLTLEEACALHLFIGGFVTGSSEGIRGVLAGLYYATLSVLPKSTHHAVSALTLGEARTLLAKVDSDRAVYFAADSRLRLRQAIGEKP